MTPAREHRPPAVLILNPQAGSLGGPEAADGVEAAVREALPGARIHRTEGPDDAHDFAIRAREEGVEELLVAGGDGTVNEVVHGLLEGGEAPGPLPTLSILPLGTGNDLARCLELPLAWEEALELPATRRGRVRRMDLLEVTLDGTRRVATNAVVVGSGGKVGQVLDPEAKQAWGPLSYLRSAAEVALELEPVEVHLAEDDGEAARVRVLNIVAANGRYAARGIPIAPGADPADGRLELVVVREATLAEVVTMAAALLREVDPEHEAYRHRRVTSLRIRAGEDAPPLPVSVDGENLEAREIRVSLLEGRLPVRAPAS